MTEHIKALELQPGRKYIILFDPRFVNARIFAEPLPTDIDAVCYPVIPAPGQTLSDAFEVREANAAPREEGE